MRDFDEDGLIISRFQAKIFSESVHKTAYSSPIFMRRFMLSNAAKRMDQDGFMYSSIAIDAIYEELDNQFGKTTYGKTKYTEDEMYWIGYIYRYWCYTHQISTKQLYKTIKPEELRKVYYPYHSLDPMAAIDRIKEAKGISEEDMLTRGVDILRRIHAREAERKGNL